MWGVKCWLLTMGTILLVNAQGPGPYSGRKRSPMTEPPFGYSSQMQSRAVDTRISLNITEGQSKGTIVGYIPTKPGFTYRFNEPPREFTLDANTGEIKTNAILDRETLKNDRYDLVVLSSQPTYPIEVRIVVVDINDNPPEFPEQSIAVSFSESAAAGTRLLLDAATDKDIGGNGVSDDYRIIAGNKNDKFKLLVTANPTGETSYLHLETTGKLDRETQGFYILNISAKDGGTPPKYGFLQVNVTILDVNDNPPIFDHSDYTVSLNESVPPGTQVLQVMATDNDLGDNAKITYYLADTERQFTVDPETGFISTTEPLECPQQNCPQTTKPAGEGCQKSCVFTVFARDHGSPRQDGRTYVTVNLEDANDHDPVIRFQYFPTTAGFATVDENAVNGSVVAAVSVVDMDEGLNGDTNVRIISGNERNHFRLDYAHSFDIVRVNGVLDREEISKYNLTVVATDRGSPPRTSTAFLIIHVNDVNDHEPVFGKSEYSAILSELAPPGTYVAGITATDEDSGVNAQIYYAFVSGNDHQWFDINSESGLITTRAVLDREVQGTVELNISARDGGPNPKWAHTQLKVTILDENDEAPEFSQARINVSLSESASPRTLVAMLTAADHDQGTNGSVTYTLHPVVQQRYPDAFLLDSLTGQLTTKTKLDREKISEYEIKVIAKDQGVPPQSSTATVFINVLDVNDNNPEFYPQQYFLPVSDDVKIGASLLKVTATDLDEGENAMITYKLESGGNNLFSVDEWTGVVTLRGNLRTSNEPIYRLKISARDHGDKRAVEDATIEIIKDAYMEELHFDNYGGYEFEISENEEGKIAKIGREVGKVRVRSSDSVTYSIVYGDPKHNFKIDEHTGKITTASKIDREQTLMYSLTIIARVGLSYGKTIVTVSILDLNDNKPVFLRDRDDVILPENAAVGQEVYLARARDMDAGINSRVTYSLSYNPDEQFRISEATGVIYLNRPVRAEPGTVLHIEVTATDGGKPQLSSKHTIAVTIQDVNDHTPVFDHTSYETSLLESTPVNDRFFALSATDADQGVNGRVSYIITEGNNEGKFGVFPDGYLYVRSPLDREDKDYYSLTVAVTDSGNPPRSSEVPVVIHVIDENDNSPQFTNTTFTFYIRENEPPDSFVGKLTATDRDIGRNAELIFSLSSSQKDFAIDPKNGFIKTLHVFDREELALNAGQGFITLEAAVTDNGNPRLKDKVKVNVYVTDVNDNPPKFLRAPYRVQISEGSSAGTQVLRLFTTDADEGLNGDVFYSIEKGNEDGRFDIDQATGQIVLARSLDREAISKYTLTVIAHDAGLSERLSSSTTVYVEVLDENDNAPEFTQTNTKISVIETTPVNTELIQFRATDADLGMNSEVVFSITAGNRRDTFHVDSTSGALYLHKPLDYEELSSYQLNVTASDNGNPRLSTTILFAISVEDANDNPPAFPNTAIVRQIREGILVHTPIVTVTAEDPDSGINGKVTYAISRQEPEDGKRYFGINPSTGVIHTLLPIDRETIDTFRLTVVATDQAQPVTARLSADKLVTVIVEDINDNAPIFVSMNSAVLPTHLDHANRGRDGVLVMNVFARDLDSSTNGLVTYDLISGNTDLFRLHRSTGALSLRREINNPEPRYQLAIKATDEAVQSERKSTDAYITIIATSAGKDGPSFLSGPSGETGQNGPGRNGPGRNGPGGTGQSYGFQNIFQKGQGSSGSWGSGSHGTGSYGSESQGSDSQGSGVQGPSFVNSAFSGSVYENEPSGTSILTVTAKFENADIEYYVTNVTGDGVQVDRLFDIDTKLGVLSTATELDREVGVDTYEIEVYAIVAGGAPKTSSTKVRITVLDKNDSPPSFKDTPLVYSVSEDLGPGQAVATLRADDPDTLGHLEYTLISEDDSHFALDKQSGVLRLVDSLDRESKDDYKLTVRASDGIQHTDTVVTVQVTDTNDNPPVFLESAYSFDIPENAVRGSRVGQVRATDPDLGSNAQLTYTVISDWANDVFSLNPQTGVFTLTARLDYEEVQHYILVVQAQDAGHPALSSTLTVYCNVLDLNDNAPLFDPMSYSNEIFENVTIGTPVVTVSATDLDSGDNGRIAYSITSGDEREDFHIASNGTIRTKRILDREVQGLYNLVVNAIDQASPPEKRLSSTVQVTIILKDVNDMSPEFITPNETSVTENIPINTVVMAIKAVDKDEGRNGYIEYSLANDPSTNGVFSLGPVDGLLRVSGRIDRELKSNYTLVVTARDRGDPPRSTQTKIFVKILDENDNSPVFDPKQYSASIAENASIGASVLQVSATDIDDLLNGRVRYSISSGDTNRDFSIAEDTGVVRVAKNLNYERKSRYLLTVRAEDCAGDISGDVVRSDTAEIAISVSDINDNPPTFLDSPYLAYVMENVIPPNGGYVITVQAYDADTPPFNSLVRYFIKEGDTDIFRINASTGEISLLRALDREIQSEYTLSLVAMDTGSPPLTGTGTVKVIVQDVNDHSPEFKRQSYKATITENSPIGSWVLTPIATDKDIGLNAKIRYSLLGDKVDRFRVDQDSGVITTAISLDREETDIYYLTLMAQDCSATEPRATAVNLTISVLDENDNSPSYSAPKYEVYISDKTKAGQFVFGAKAVDIDMGVNSKITYHLSGEHARNFTINVETGVIKALHDLYKSSTTVFNLEIEAKDSGRTPRSASTELKVFLRPSHLFPSFTSPAQTHFVLAENVEEGKLIAKFKATSPKKGPAGNVKFAIAGGNIGEALKMDKNTGEVQVAGKGLDYETAPQYEVWIEAIDSDSPPLRSVLQLIINVTDANDNPPVMNNALYNASILEEEAPPQLVVKVSATDADSGENGQVTYRLVDDFEGAFEMDAESGEIYTNVRLDREDVPSYELIVEAIDQGAPQLSGTATVLVTVLDKNDNPPRFTRLFSVNVTENAEIGSFVIRVTSSDQDIGENANATYSFTENPGEKFKIDPISGNVTVVGALDREQQDEYLLKVAATDRAWSAETPLTITIQDQNDNAPEFEHSYYSFNFPELQRDIVFVGQVSATDRDKQGPNSVISYSLQQPSDLFTVDPASGEIFSKRSLKYKYTQLEASPENMYSLTILATDNGKPPMSSECLVTINIVDANNNAPQFEQNEYLSPVPNDAVEGQRLLKVTAKDSLDFGVNAEIEYSIVAGNGSEFFIIDRSTGWVTLAKTISGIGRIFTLRVRATDRGVPPQQDEVSVTLVITGENKFTPVFTALSYQVIVPENEPLSSTILTVSATDNDQGPNGMVRYEISAGNERKEFSVDPISGAITILQPLDYDTVQEYHLNVTAQDLGFKPHKATAMLTITLTDINDNSPTFNQSLYEAYIAENLPPNSPVYQVVAKDIDSPKNAIIQYSIVGGSGKDVFNIDQRSGIITAKISFDYEENNLFNLNIIATNPDSTMYGTSEVVVHITGVNEYYPRFIQPVFHFDVSESTEVGTSIGTIQATDQDSGEDGKVYYLFVGSSNDRGFSINPESGTISVSRNLDRETQSRVVLTVMAKNAGGIRGNDTDEAQVIVSIQDGNDPPEFLQNTYEAQISEGASTGTKVIMVKAVDKDVRPQNNQFAYSIIGGNTEQAFKIDPQTGEIETSRALDRETIPLYSLIVGGIDTGIPPQTGTATVKIHVTDINDNGPVFDPPQVTGTVYENEPPNTKVMTLSAKDPDLPPNGAPFSYRLIGGKQRDFIKIDKHTGVIVTTRNIDRETTPELNIIVEVEDSGVPRMKSQHKIKINVLDQNDSPSSPRSVHVLVQAFNGAFPLGKIADVHPNDPDTSGDYKCKILQGHTLPGVLSIPSGCSLHTSRITPGPGYSLSISGNDGKHTDVVSTVTVEFLNFDNATVENSITVRVANMTAQKFLAHGYRGLLELLKGTLTSGETLLLYGLHDNKGLHDNSLYETQYNSQGLEENDQSLQNQRNRGQQDKNLQDKGLQDKSLQDRVLQDKDLYNKSLYDKSLYDKSVYDRGSYDKGQYDRGTYDKSGFDRSIYDKSIYDKSTYDRSTYDKSSSDKSIYDKSIYDKVSSDNEPTMGTLEITLAIKTQSSYRSKSYTAEKIQKKHEAMVNLFHSDVTINYSPCSENTCENGGICTEEITVQKSTTITDSQSIIFTSPLITHNYTCQCSDGFTGQNCNKRQDPCLPNPCRSNGQCIKQGYNFQCVCPSSKGGRFCELEKGDACSENPCQNGGSCKESPDGSSFFCLCRPGYRGNHCEALADSCRPNPCLNGGLCVSTKPGYKCSCTDGRYGRHCEKSTFGFGELSYMTFPPLDATTNDISFVFATTKPDSLLVYNYGLQTGGRSDFIAIELVNGRAVFAFGGARTAITSVSVSGKSNNLADGNWHKITATRNRRVLSLSVASCSENGDVCEECRPGDSSCYAVIGADDIGTLNFNNQPLLIGGLSSADPVLERPGQVHSDDLVGCVHSISVNGRQLNLSSPIQSHGIENTCGRRGSCSASTSDPCLGFGQCLDRWHSVSCNCGGNHIAPNCRTSLQPISVSDGGYVEFSISEKHRRMQLLDSLYGGSTVWSHHRKIRSAQESSVQERSIYGRPSIGRSIQKRSTTQSVQQNHHTPAKSVSLLFRTVKQNGIIFYATSNKHYTSVELVNGQIAYISKLSNTVNLTDSHPMVTDGQWHNITLHAHSRGLEILLNGERLGDELDSAGVHDFLDPYLSYMSLGGARPNMYYVSKSQPKFFEGCLANFSINNEIQPFNGSGSVFSEVLLRGKVTKDCNGPIGVGTATATDPLSIGITLVIVFFIVLLVAILVSFVVFRLRKQNKEKGGAPGSPAGIHSKQNGGTTMMNTNGLVSTVNDNVLGRPLHGNDNSMGYHSENGDVIRGIGGHPLVGPELLSKKFKEREILQNDLPRPQRPDIIEREVVSKSPPMREDHHPPLPPSSNHNHDHGPADLNSELPEHYDLENASSIAPSDIDIVYHYKGYREAGGVRKYKAPPVGGYHHKHGPAQAQAQHRHSPHHPAGFPPRAPPVTSSASRTHQSTPLARLSPSSEMSAQQPRILTLHDISGKPLQSALLATTSSSGGVGKDVLHSNSERSLNSPVMSQLSGQSSSSRKVQAPPPVTSSSPGMGLTAEEIERLNSRPRTSSLVSTLDAVSSSSEAPRGNVPNHLNHMHHSPVPETHHSSTTTDESGNDSFTCSEIEYDNASLAGDKYKPSEVETRRNDSSSSNKNPVAPPSYDGFDSSYRGSMSTLVASDEDIGGPLYRPPAESPSTTALGWDYLLNWGPNFESLAGVFKDIAELPDSVNGRVPSSLRLTNAPKPSEEYV